ncbi:hypothetical protein L2E82_22246 [Cichorium intybus]|uniref:Uncharacterized protein n=1 Tax=Cichorium intybus TaxID=13427 RepID=A0ACB9DWX7_CICIN|nr:hypothetical protein L2E82_22246 [Cichorium intybus]
MKSKKPTTTEGNEEENEDSICAKVSNCGPSACTFSDSRSSFIDSWTQCSSLIPPLIYRNGMTLTNSFSNCVYNLSKVLTRFQFEHHVVPAKFDGN